MFLHDIGILLRGALIPEQCRCLKAFIRVYTRLDAEYSGSLFSLDIEWVRDGVPHIDHEAQIDVRSIG